jgi:hypothetical protein
MRTPRSHRAWVLRVIVYASLHTLHCWSSNFNYACLQLAERALDALRAPRHTRDAVPPRPVVLCGRPLALNAKVVLRTDCEDESNVWSSTPVPIIHTYYKSGGVRPFDEVVLLSVRLLMR